MVDTAASKPVIISSTALSGEPETQVNTTTTGDQKNPAIARLDDGYVVSWTGPSGMYFQRLDAEGHKVGAEMEITGSAGENSAILATEDGFTVFWTNSADDISLYRRSFDASGAASSPETDLNLGTSVAEKFVSVTPLQGGGFFAAWQQLDADAFGVSGAFYNADGTIRSPGIVQVNETVSGFQNTPSVTTLSDGRVVVTWEASTGDGGYEVYGRIMGPDGSTGPEFRIGGEVSTNQQQSSVAALSDGGFVVAWADVNSKLIYVERYDATGTATSNEIALPSVGGTFQLSPEVTALADGGFAVAWIGSGRTYVLSLDADGEAIGAPVPLGNISNATNVPDIIALDDGGFAAVWQSSNQDGNGSGIYSRVFHPESGTIAAQEDHTITLPTRIALADADGSEVLQSISISGLPAGFSLDVGQRSGGPASAWVIDRGAATAEFLDALAAGEVQIEINPAANWNGDLTLSITATSRETNGGATSTSDAFDVEVSVAAENDAPEATHLDQSLAYTEDRGRVQLEDIVVSDIDGDQITATLTLSNANAGSLVGGVGTYDPDTGTYAVTGTVAEVNAALAAVEFLPAVNANDEVQITVEIDDGSATPITGTMTLEGTAVSDAPRLSIGLPIVAVGSEETPVEGGDAEPSITSLANGGWVVTWSGGFGDRDVRQQVYGPDGQPVGGDSLVHEVSSAQQMSPSVTSLADGGWVVTWRDYRNGNYDIYQRVFDSHGESADGDVLVTEAPGSNFADAPSVTALAGGGWVITWQDPQGGPDDIYQRVYDSDGQPVGAAQTLVNSVQSGRQTDATVTALTDGRWVVTWVDSRNDSGDIYQRVFGADGEPAGVETQVNTASESWQGRSSVAALADGGWVVTWSSPATGSDVYQQVYGANGQPVGTETQVNSETGGGQINADVTALSDGGWVVTWWGSGSQVYQRVYGADREPIGDADILVGSHPTSGDNPSVTALPGGGWVLPGAVPASISACSGRRRTARRMRHSPCR